MKGFLLSLWQSLEAVYLSPILFLVPCCLPRAGLEFPGGVGQDTIALDQEPHHSQWWLESTSMAGQVGHMAQACFAGERALLIPKCIERLSEMFLNKGFPHFPSLD